MQDQSGPSPSGISGEIGPIGGAAEFQGSFYAWALRAGADFRPRFGPATGGEFNYRAINKDRSLAFSGVTLIGATVEPAKWQGQTKNVVLQYGINQVALAAGTSLADASFTITVTVVIESFKVERNTLAKANPDSWVVSGTAKVIGAPFYSAAWGSQPSGGTVTKSDQVLYTGMSLTLDTADNGLVGNQKYVIDYWTLTDDSDAGRKSKLLQAMAAAVPADPRFKQRPATILPDSPDGGSIQIEFALRDTYDDVNQPADIKNTDPDGLTNNYTWSAINGTPADPGVLNTQVIGQEVRILVDGKLQFINKGGGFTPRQAIEEGDTNYRFDVNSLENEGVSYVTYTTASGVPNSPAAPNGLQIVGTSSIATSHFKSKLKTDYGVRSPAQQLTFPETEDTTDPNNIAMTARRAQVYDIGSPPAVPTDLPTGNVKELRFVDIPKTPTLGETVGKMIRIWYYGGKDSKDELLLEHYRTTSDTNALQSSAVRAALDGDTNPTTVADSFGHTLVQRPSTVIPVTLGLGTNRVLTITEYGLRTTKEDITDEESEVVADGLLLDSSAKTTEVYATSGGVPADAVAPLDELTIAATRVQVLNQIESKRTTVFSTLNSEDRRAFELIKTTKDGNLIDEDAVCVKYWVRGTTRPTAPDSPPGNNVKLRYNFTKDLTSVGKAFAGINMEVFVYGARDSKDSLILERYETTTDESALESSAVRSFLDGDSIPDTIADANSVTLYKTKVHVKPVTLALGTNRILYVVEYELTSTADDVTFPESPIRDGFATGGVQRVTTLENSDTGTSLSTFKDTQRALNVGSKQYAELEARQYKRSLKLLTVTTIEDNKAVRGLVRARKESLANVGNAVKVVQAIPQGSNGTQLRFGRYDWWRTVGQIEVERRFLVTTDPDDSLLHSNQWTTRNIARTAGFNVGFLMFTGAEWNYKGGLSTGRPISITYFLEVDSLQFQPELVATGVDYFTTATGIVVGDNAFSSLALGTTPSSPTLSDLSFIFA